MAQCAAGLLAQHQQTRSGGSGRKVASSDVCMSVVGFFFSRGKFSRAAWHN